MDKFKIDYLIYFLIIIVMFHTLGIMEPYYFFRALMVFGLLFLVVLMIRENPGRPWYAYPEVPFVLLFVWGYISTITSVDPTRSIDVFFQVMFPTIALFMATLYASKPKKLLAGILSVVVLAGTLHAVYTLIGYGFGSRTVEAGRWLKVTIGSFEMDQLYLGERPTGLTKNPNSLGIWVYMGVLSLLYLKREKIIPWLVFIPLVLLNFSALMLSQSRASMAALAASAIFYLVWSVWGKLKLKKSSSMSLRQRVIMLVLPLISVALLGWVAADNFVSRLSGGLSGREVAWVAIYEYSRENPIIGAGVGMAREVLRAFGVGIGPHSVYLKILAETGLVGLYLMLLFIFMLTAVAVWHIRKKTGISSVVFNGAFLMSLFIHQLFEDQMFRLHPLHFLFVVFSALLIRGYQDKERMKQRISTNL